MAGSKKCRNWWFVQRIDQLPADWRTQLDELMIPGCYIVHERDTKLDIDTGTWLPVAPHIHCIVQFGNAVRAKTVLDALPDSFNVKMVKPVTAIAGAYRYMMHYEIADKAPYDRDEIIHMHGFKVNVSDVFNVDFANVYELINEHRICNFAVLMSFLVEFKPEYISYVSGHVQMVKAYLQEYARLQL